MDRLNDPTFKWLDHFRTVARDDFSLGDRDDVDLAERGPEKCCGKECNDHKCRDPPDGRWRRLLYFDDGGQERELFALGAAKRCLALGFFPADAPDFEVAF